MSARKMPGLACREKDTWPIQEELSQWPRNPFTHSIHAVAACGKAVSSVTAGPVAFNDRTGVNRWGAGAIGIAFALWRDR
jgi:hypothetical protein